MTNSGVTALVFASWFCLFERLEETVETELLSLSFADTVDFDDHNNSVQQQQSTRLKQQQQHLASVELHQTEAEKDFALAAPDTLPHNQNEANRATTENGRKVEPVKEDLFISSLVKRSDCKGRVFEARAGGSVGSRRCRAAADSNSSAENVKDGSCHVNRDDMTAVMLDHKVSALTKAKLSKMKTKESCEEDFVQKLTFHEKAVESNELRPVQCKNNLEQCDAKVCDVNPGQPNKRFMGENMQSINLTCGPEVADGLDDDSMKPSSSKVIQTREIASDCAGVLHEMTKDSAVRKSFDSVGHRTEDATIEASCRNITDSTQNNQSRWRQRTNKSVQSIGRGLGRVFGPSSAEEAGNFVKKLESFVASVSSEGGPDFITCHKKSELQEMKTTCIPSYVDKCCQLLAPGSGHLSWETTSLLQQSPPDITNENVTDHPLDLSNKTNSNNSPLVSSCSSWSMLFNAGFGQLSSLARLEETFGAKSAILDQVGIWPSNSSVESSRLPFTDGHHDLTVQEESTGSLSWKVTMTEALSFSKDVRGEQQPKQLLESSEMPADGSRKSADCAENVIRRSPSELLYAGNSCEPISLRIDRPPVSSPDPLRCISGELTSELTTHQHASGHSWLKEADTCAADDALHGQSARLSQRYQRDMESILRCIECGLLFQSLSELTVHMSQMAHYLNLIHPDHHHHQRPPSSSMCSPVTLDSFNGDENSSSISEQSGWDGRDKPLSQTHPLWQDFFLLSQARENACSSSTAENIQRLTTKHHHHKRSTLNRSSSERTDSLRKVQRLDPSAAWSSDNEYKYHVGVKHVSLREDYCSTSSEANSDSISISPISIYEFETFMNKKSICLDSEKMWNDKRRLSPDGGRNVSALMAMQNFVQQSFLTDQTPDVSICDKETSSSTLENNPTPDVRCRQLPGSPLLKKASQHSSSNAAKKAENQLLMDSRKTSPSDDAAAAKICLNLSKSQQRKTRNCRRIVESERRNDASPDSCRKNTVINGNKLLCESL